jgi:hypothetical protein
MPSTQERDAYQETRDDEKTIPRLCLGKKSMMTEFTFLMVPMPVCVFNGNARPRNPLEGEDANVTHAVFDWLGTRITHDAVDDGLLEDRKDTCS